MPARLLTNWSPHPVFSATLLVVWLLLVGELSAGALVLGGVLALLVPWATRAFWPDRPRIYRRWLLVRLLMRVLWDIVVANVVVARLILGRTRRLRPAFVTLPLALRDRFAVTLLANIITLTPGTVTVHVTADLDALVIHALDVDDPQSLVDEIKNRYEVWLKEIFECSTPP